MDPRLARPMRTTAVLLLALTIALLAPTVQAQPPTFSQPYQVRAGQGELSTVDGTEPANGWNVEQRLTVTVDPAAAESARTFRFAYPAGARLVNASCTCAFTRQESASGVNLTVVPPTAAGQHTLRVLTTQALGDGVAMAVRAPASVDGVVILYVPAGFGPASSIDLTEVGSSTTGDAVIHYGTLPAGTAAFVTVGKGLAQPATTAGGEDEDSPLMEWVLPVALGLVLGVVLWATLVSKGLVQAKSRKQVAATAAHVEAAASDPPAVLEGKKRALLAALKEVELAKQANEMPVEVYDAVKADLKKQAVTVMRALETSPDQPKA